jgi:hypothetical protein
MLKILQRLFGSSGETESKGRGELESLAKEIAVTNQYQEDLINGFKEDHLELFDIYQKIVDQFTEDRTKHGAISELLDEFESLLNIHILQENAQLYTYLQEINKDDKVALDLLDKIQKEMNGIVKSAEFFARKYKNHQSYESNIDNFAKDAQDIATVLTKRVKMEEKRLYTMYVKREE